MFGMIIKIAQWIFEHVEFECTGIKKAIILLWIKLHTKKHPDVSDIKGFSLEENEHCVYIAKINEGKVFVSDIRIAFWVNNVLHEVRGHSTIHVDSAQNGMNITLNDETFFVSNFKFLKFLYRTIWVSALRETREKEAKRKLKIESSNEEASSEIPTYYITVKQAADDVREYKKLMEEGIISSEEYERKRVELLRL